MNNLSFLFGVKINKNDALLDELSAKSLQL
jgi:hypothetical protein